MGRVTKFHSDNARREAGNLYAISGSLSDVSRRTGIAVSVIHDWANGRSDPNGVFVESLENARKEIAVEFVGKFENVCSTALARLSERLENDPDSISGSQLAVISGVAMDKALVLSNRPNSIRASVGVTELANEFRKLSSQNQAQASQQCIVDSTASDTE